VNQNNNILSSLSINYPADLANNLYNKWQYEGYVKASKYKIFHPIMRDNFVDDYIEKQLREFFSKEK
jgi:hypothetical protein